MIFPSLTERDVLTLCCSDVDAEYSQDWVVEVEGGLEEATRVAAQAELEVLGEVMEASNIFHLRQRRRVRRSAGDLERELRANSRVKTFSHQAVHKVRKYIIYIIYSAVYQTIVWYL